ncbi:MULTISPECIES: hypothetical protein [Mycolicibacterium]|uniref:Uncharacterized protein n=1 Tax=Mycolicibacterium vanbaalenii (strain DSM 7251 / JCM 13017 / BCRC 16820 / KCTC 9966 / NRRL B-24157 / PYR-1) TaxID=350058 RepID=A1TBD2_MYCVP|nr:MULTISPECIES: hypothetical protein [Mycolicibacterium]ABM14482.1 conserved hypothetical protein [Mycolicibacterium vanbaalenii PYR-1]
MDTAKEIGSMTDTPESTSERMAVAGERRGVNHALAWSGIAAAAVFIVAVVFFSGFFIGRATDGFGGNRGQCQGTPGMMGPGMMGPGMMGPQGSWSPGNMGPSGPWGPGQWQPPTTTPTTPRP